MSWKAATNLRVPVTSSEADITPRSALGGSEGHQLGRVHGVGAGNVPVGVPLLLRARRHGREHEWSRSRRRRSCALDDGLKAVHASRRSLDGHTRNFCQ